MKLNKTLIAGIAAGAIAGAFVVSNKKEIKEKIKGAAGAIKDAGNLKLMQVQAVANGLTCDVAEHAKEVANKIMGTAK